MFFFSSRRRHTRYIGDWSSDVCSSDLEEVRMRRVAVIIVAVVVAGASGTVAQEAYPTRPVTIVNPFPPGGIADLTARPLAAEIGRASCRERAWIVVRPGGLLTPRAQCE